MLPVTKHPDATIVVIAVFSKQLAPGETLVTVTAQPALVDPPDSALTIGPGTINGADVSLPEGFPTVPANHGVQFTSAGGTNLTTYKALVKATTSRGNLLAEDCPIVVKR